MEKKASRVCVTGGSGYIGSWLIKKLLEKGHTVHATLRNLEDVSKVGLLKSLPIADTNLLLFRADIYDPNEFEPAIEGWEFVFHLATPRQHNSQSSQYKDTTEAAIAGLRSIADSCIRLQTVKATDLHCKHTFLCRQEIMMELDSDPYLNESCWTPRDVPSTVGCSPLTFQSRTSNT